MRSCLSDIIPSYFLLDRPFPLPKHSACAFHHISFSLVTFQMYPTSSFLFLIIFQWSFIIKWNSFVCASFCLVYMMVLCLDEKQCALYSKRWLMLIRERRKEMLYSERSAYEASYNNPTLGLSDLLIYSFANVHSLNPLASLNSKLNSWVLLLKTAVLTFSKGFPLICGM